MANNAAVSKQSFQKLTPEEIQDYIDIATEVLVEILQQRGLTAEEFRARRKQITAEEQNAITEELKGLGE